MTGIRTLRKETQTPEDLLRAAARKEAESLVDKLCHDPAWYYRGPLIDLIAIKLLGRDKEIAALQQALEPFAKVGKDVHKSMADIHPVAEVDTCSPDAKPTTLSAKDFRAAAKAYSGKADDGNHE